MSGELFRNGTILKNAASYTTGNFLDAFYTAKGWTSLHQDDRELAYEASSPWTGGTVNLADPDEIHREQRVAFNASWQTRLADEDVILECDVTESVTYSGVRWVEHRRPDGPSVFQNCGTESATRQVSGSVRSTRLTTCQTFAAAKRKLLDCRKESPTTDAFEDPPAMTTRYEWVPRPASAVADDTREGDGQAGAVDVAVYAVEFRYQERIPERTLALPSGQ